MPKYSNQRLLGLAISYAIEELSSFREANLGDAEEVSRINSLLSGIEALRSSKFNQNREFTFQAFDNMESYVMCGDGKFRNKQGQLMPTCSY